MDKIEKLILRRGKLLEIGKEIREKISEFTDEKSFVELDAYSFSKNDFYGEEAEGEGVITGYATVNGSPVYIIAQNAKVLSGGVSHANCQKIRKCLEKARNNNVPVVYFLDSKGVVVGEGVNVLEGIAQIISLSASMKGFVPQYAVVLGKLYGSFSILCANCDYAYMLDGAEIAYASPLVIAATSGRNMPSEKTAGYDAAAKTGLNVRKIKSVSEARELFIETNGLSPAFSSDEETDDDFNRTADELNEQTATPEKIIEAVFDYGKFTPYSDGYCPEISAGTGKIGGMSVGAVIFGGGEKGVELTSENVRKIRRFTEYANAQGFPLVFFVNALGIRADVATVQSDVLSEISDLLVQLCNAKRISVVYGKAIGLGYTLFASKSCGTEYAFAFANANIALFDGAASAVEFGEVSQEKFAELAERYSEENADPINAAKNGYIDNVIEPRLVRPYLVSALMSALV